MLAQALELIIFAGIALFIINKLINTLGKTSEDDPTRKSFFGENNGSLKDVTNTAQANDRFSLKFFKSKHADYDEYIIAEHKQAIYKGIAELEEKMLQFDLKNFLKGAKGAFKMILEAAATGNQLQLAGLIDRRYLEPFKNMASQYGQYKNTDNQLLARVAEIYLFGNNAFIKVLFVGNNITDKMGILEEEWTFTKNIQATDNAWFLTNIDKI